MHVFTRCPPMMIRVIAAAAMMAAAITGATAQTPPAPDMPAPETPANDPPPLGRLDRSVVPEGYAINLTIDPRRETFSGDVAITVTLAEATDRIWIHGRGLDVGLARLITARGDSIRMSYREVDPSGVARLDLDRLAPAGRARIVLRYEAPFADGLTGLYKVEEDGNTYAFTQFEAISARRAFPGFDEPAFKVPFDITLTVPADMTAVTATPAIATQTSTLAGERMKTVRFAPTRPLPTYLLAFIVGGFDVVEAAPLPPNAVRDRPVPLRALAVKGKGDGLDFALSHTGEIVAEMERYFGIPYPYEAIDLIAVPDFAPNAMENVGAITYRESRILMGARPSVAEIRFFMYIHAHELAHQWFGNLVTPEWWDDIWLNESFATWMGYRALTAIHPDAQFDRDMLRNIQSAFEPDSLVHARRIAQPVTDRDGIANAFDAITYAKGGGVLAMFESYLGAETFRAGIRTYLRRFADATATADDFIAALADAAGNPAVADAFRSFLDRPGLPLLRADRQCGSSPAAISLTQSHYLPLGSEGARAGTWGLPACVKSLRGGRWHRQCALIQQRSVDLAADDACPDAVMPNAGGAGYYRWSVADEDMDALLAAFRTMTPREQLSMVDSLDADFRAGRRDIDTHLDAAARIARSPVWDVSTAPMETLTFIADHIVPAERIESFRQRVGAFYLPQLTSLDPFSDGVAVVSAATETRLKSRIVDFLAFTARAPALRAELTDRAFRHLEDGRHLQDGSGHGPDAIDPNLLGIAFRVAVEEEGTAALSHLLPHLDATDPATRSKIVAALGHARDAVAISRIRELILSPRLRDNEVGAVLSGQMASAETRAGTWAWITESYAALTERMVGRGRRALIELSAHFCSMERRDEVKAFFQPRIADFEGGERTLDIALERIALCAALVRHHAPPPAAPDAALNNIN